MRRFLFVTVAAFAVAVVPGCVNPLDPQDGSGPGERAADYLSNARYSRMLVEVDYVQGSAPNSRALSLLSQRIEENTAKGQSVEIRQEGGVAGRGSGHKYSLDEVRELEAKSRRHFSENQVAVLYVLYLDGGYAADAGSSKVLAAAYRGSSVVVFKQNVRDSSRPDGTIVNPLDPRPEEAEVEESVMVHEFGHIVGLVNNGIAMVQAREDPEHPGHSSNQNSVMYWAVETNALLNVFGLDPIPDDFDSNDKADMARESAR